LRLQRRMSKLRCRDRTLRKHCGPRRRCRSGGLTPSRSLNSVELRSTPDAIFAVISAKVWRALLITVGPLQAEYVTENKGNTYLSKRTFYLRKCLGEGRIAAVRLTLVFLQYGTSARLVAPLICMPAPEHALSRDSRVRINGTPQCLEESSLRRVRFPA
jgi:hypothetical protein